MDSTFAGCIPQAVLLPREGRGLMQGAGTYGRSPQTATQVNTVGALANPHGPGVELLQPQGSHGQKGPLGPHPDFPPPVSLSPGRDPLMSFKLPGMGSTPGSRRVSLPNSSISLKVCTRDHSVASDTFKCAPRGAIGEEEGPALPLTTVSLTLLSISFQPLICGGWR